MNAKHAQMAVPFSIKLIAFLAIFSEARKIPTLFSLETTTSIFGFYVSGWVGVVHEVCVIVLGIGSALGLWFLKEWARKVVIGLESYVLFSFLLPLTIPPMRQQFLSLLGIPAGTSVEPIEWVLFWVVLFVLPVVRYGFVLYFLITRRKAFHGSSIATT